MEQGFNCKSCEAVFNTKTKLDSHRREAHQVSCKVLGVLVTKDERGFKCPFCQKSFSISGTLQKHAKICRGKSFVDESVESGPPFVVESVPPFVVVESVPPFVVESVEAVQPVESNTSVFDCPVFKGLNLIFNTKFALLICKTCNIGLKQEPSAVFNHFKNKVHAKTVVRKFKLNNAV